MQGLVVISLNLDMLDQYFHASHSLAVACNVAIIFAKKELSRDGSNAAGASSEISRFRHFVP